MIALGFVRRQVEVGEDRAEKQPRAEFAADEIGVLALPAEAGRRGERLLHHRRGVDEHLDLDRLGTGRGDEPGGERLQLAFDHLVIVAVAGVDGDRAAVLALQRRERIDARVRS